VNIFPLAWVVNKFRKVKINSQSQLIMWFTGLRGAIAFALALNVQGRHGAVILSTTLGIVLFTIVVFGGTTLPLLKFTRMINNDFPSSINLSKTEGVCIDAAQLKLAEKDPEGWFESLDNQYMKSFFRS